jgi:MinD-like ATPase involved in chromosome partitioning or flagellar assembly
MSLVITIDGPSGKRLVSVPENATVADLLPGLVEVCEGSRDSAGWKLAPQGEGAMDGAQTLAQVGLYDGAVVRLIAPEPKIAVAPPTPVAAPAPPRIERMDEFEYRRMLDGAIAASGARASSVIAVVGLHPGAGATTVVALLSTLLSSLRGEQLCAVDANTESGALSHWLVPESALRGEAYESLFAADAGPREVASALVAANPRMVVLPAPVDTSLVVAAEPAAWGRVIEHLRHLHHVVVIDCGAGLRREAVQAAIGAADQVVLVARAEASDRENVEPALALLRKLAKPVVVVRNESRRRERTRRSAAGIQRVTLTFEPASATQLKRRGFDWSEAPAAWNEGVRELAALLVASG